MHTGDYARRAAHTAFQRRDVNVKCVSGVIYQQDLTQSVYRQVLYREVFSIAASRAVHRDCLAFDPVEINSYRIGKYDR